MISSKDKKWLENILGQGLDGSQSKDRYLLEGFSMLVRNMVKNIERDFEETRALWRQDPTSKELKQRFDALARCLLYLERYCREKIGRELK